MTAIHSARGGRIRDVVIAGAGPAGSTLARELASQGADVLLLEKERLPRYKPCAGGVTARAAALLPFELSDLIEDVIYKARISFRLRETILKTTEKPITYMVMRDRFDHLLCSKASQAGAEVRENEAVLRLSQGRDSVRVEMTSGTVAARFVVGADGAGSAVATSCGLMTSVRRHFGLQAEVETSEEILNRWRGTVGLDFGLIPTGYTWVFPKSTHLSVGAGAPAGLANQLRHRLSAQLHYLGLAQESVTKLRGHGMPLRRRGQAIAKGRCLLIGDAAGLMDPFTGEGIYPAVKSALLATHAILNGLASGTDAAKEYQRAVDLEMLPEARLAWGLSRLASIAPHVIYKRFCDDARVWKWFCMFLRGDTTYASLVKTLGPVRHLLRLTAL